MDCQISNFHVYKFHQDRSWAQNQPKCNPSFGKGSLGNATYQISMHLRRRSSHKGVPLGISKLR